MRPYHVAWPAQNSLCASGCSWTCNYSPVSVSSMCWDCRRAPLWSAIFALPQGQQWRALCDRIIHRPRISLRKFLLKDFGHLKIIIFQSESCLFFFYFLHYIMEIKVFKIYEVQFIVLIFSKFWFGLVSKRYLPISEWPIIFSLFLL